MKAKRATGFDYILVLLFLLVLVITIYPFMNVLAISFNDALDTLKNINMVFPRVFTLSNYKYVFTDASLLSAFFLSVSRTVVGTMLSLICTAMLAYTLSRKDFLFHKFFTILFVITMYVGGGLIPDYLLIVRTLRLGNSFLVYIIPGLIWVFNVILIRSYIDGLPYALQEAATLDGANDFQIWQKMILPLCTPVMATVALFYAVGQWNSFMDTYLYANQLPTMQYKLYEIMAQATMKMDVHGTTNVTTAVTPMSIRMAVTIVATVPIVVVYPFLQRYFIGGMTIGSVKS